MSKIRRLHINEKGRIVYLINTILLVPDKVSCCIFCDMETDKLFGMKEEEFNQKFKEYSMKT